MAEKLYFVHFSGENLGPIQSQLMQKLIQMGRLHGQDYAALQGSGQWKRLCDMPEFSSLFAGAPTIGVPKTAASVAPVAAPAPGPAAYAAPAPAPKVEAPKAQVQVPKVEVPKAEPPKVLQGVVTIGKKVFKIVEVRQAGLLLEANGDLEEGSEVAMQISGQSFPKPFEMKAILVGKEAYQGMNVYMTEFVRPNPAHKRTLAAFIPGSDKE